MNPVGNMSTLRAREAIRSFVRNRKSDFPISIADLAKRVRYVLPGFDGTERDLADLIAREIIDAGGNVSFDGPPAVTGNVAHEYLGGADKAGISGARPILPSGEKNPSSEPWLVSAS